MAVIFNCIDIQTVSSVGKETLFTWSHCYVAGRDRIYPIIAWVSKPEKMDAPRWEYIYNIKLLFVKSERIKWKKKIHCSSFPKLSRQLQLQLSVSNFPRWKNLGPLGWENVNRLGQQPSPYLPVYLCKLGSSNNSYVFVPICVTSKHRLTHPPTPLFA